MNRTLATITAELDQAKQDVALLARLTNAPDRIKLLIPEHEKAIAAHDKVVATKAKAVADEAQAAHDAKFAGLSGLTITEIIDAHSTSVLSRIFRIAWTRPAWSANDNATVPQTVSVSGFVALEPYVFAWIVERHPDKIPASIMALAPNDVDEAFDRYFVGLRRGYLTA